MSTYSIKITFTEQDLNDILSAANFHDDNPVTVAELKRDGKFNRFMDELQATEFVTEIVEGSYDACANDWLAGYGRDDYEAQ